MYQPIAFMYTFIYIDYVYKIISHAFHFLLSGLLGNITYFRTYLAFIVGQPIC